MVAFEAEAAEVGWLLMTPSIPLAAELSREPLLLLLYVTPSEKDNERVCEMVLSIFSLIDVTYLFQFVCFPDRRRRRSELAPVYVTRWNNHSPPSTRGRCKDGSELSNLHGDANEA